MSAGAQKRLQAAATSIKQEEQIAKQAKAGEQRLSEILKDNVSKFKLPGYISAKATTTNALLTALESKLNKNTMNALTYAAKSAKNFDELLSGMPVVERSKFVKALNDPKTRDEVTRLVRSGYVGSNLSEATKEEE